MAQLLIDNNKCNQCKLCVVECPINIIRIREGDSVPSFIGGGSRLCLDCGHCLAVCPTGALSRDSVGPDQCLPTGKQLLPTSVQSENFLKARRSVRVYKDHPVEREKLEKIIDIARYAPSGHNGQPVEWLVITDKKEVKQLAALTADWLRLLIKEMPQVAAQFQAKRVVTGWDSGLDTISRNAPHLILAHGNKEMQARDFVIALEYLELAAFSQGLGACWAGYMQGAAAMYPPMMQALKLPEGHQSFGAMLIGYPAHRLVRIPPRNEAKIIWH